MRRLILLLVLAPVAHAQMDPPPTVKGAEHTATATGKTEKAATDAALYKAVVEATKAPLAAKDAKLAKLTLGQVALAPGAFVTSHRTTKALAQAEAHMVTVAAKVETARVVAHVDRVRAALRTRVHVDAEPRIRGMQVSAVMLRTGQTLLDDARRADVRIKLVVTLSAAEGGKHKLDTLARFFEVAGAKLLGSFTDGATVSGGQRGVATWVQGTFARRLHARLLQALIARSGSAAEGPVVTLTLQAATAAQQTSLVAWLKKQPGIAGVESKGAVLKVKTALKLRSFYKLLRKGPVPLKVRQMDGGANSMTVTPR